MQPTNSESGDPASSTAYSSSTAHAYSGWRWAWGRRLNRWRFDRRAHNRWGFDGRRNVRCAPSLPTPALGVWSIGGAPVRPAA